MKIFNKALIIVLVFILTLGLVGPVKAATAVALGTAANFAVLAGSGITNTGATTITGDVGSYPTLTQTGFGSVTLNGTNHLGNATTQQAKTDLVTAYNDAAGQGGASAIVADLGGQTLTPGVYNSGSSIGLTGTLTLDGGGDANAVFVLQAGSTLTTASDSHVTLTNGTQACNVFWQVGSSATLGTTSDFKGNILALASITDNGGSTIAGRLLARDAAVTLKNTTVSKATCAGATPATLHVIKVVTNNSGRSAVVSDFNLYVKFVGDNVAGSPTVGAASPGTSYSLAAGTYVVSEDANAFYTQSFSGDCDSNGSISLISGADKTCTITNDDIAPATINVVKTVVNNNGQTKVVADFPLFVSGTSVVSGATNIFSATATYTVTENSYSQYTSTFSGDCDSDGNITLIPGNNKFCIITNDDIAPPAGGGGSSLFIAPTVPPLIDVVKVPSPLALPNGPGLVKYAYTVRNIGIVSMTNITMVGDTCSPIILASGDSDNDAILDLTETWEYTCSTTLTETHTNTVVATGWSNGVSSVDIASATVVVGASIVPPLIHIVKKPNVFIVTAGNGAVTYTYAVTNPGTEPLSNVSVTDDKCTGLPSRVLGHPGDLNKNNLLESNEVWSFTCQTYLTQTTTNTGTASGQANGITVKDLAIATVVVAASVVPGLPNAGYIPEGSVLPWIIAIFGVAVLAVVLLVISLKRKI